MAGGSAMDKPLTGDLRSDGGVLDLAAYEAVGGYEALRRVFREMTPADVLKEVTDSRLRGRGGAGFPTGQKWSFVPMGDDAPTPKYLVANADEMEPGTFKDRILLEGNPHLLIEGMVLAAYAIQAATGYVFLRWAYKVAAERIARALGEAYDKGYLGKNVLGSDFGFDLRLHTSAGRYMCGEETGLLNALEGKRANPRAKPPFPQVSGLWGKPTIVQNVETLCNVAPILRNGARWYLDLSRSEDGGTKLYGVSGRVKRPGAWELPLGTTIREILERRARGMRDGYRFRGLLPGGASTDFLVEEHLDVKMDYQSVQAAGSRLGTGLMIVLDHKTSVVGMVLNLERFFAQESCGWCTPCRDGLPWTARILQGLLEGRGRRGDLERLEMHTRMMGPGNTFCALAPGAMEPLQSALKYFREDFEKLVPRSDAA